MFTWICPQCRSEVPPSYTECPNCANRKAAPVETAAAQPEQPQHVPPPAARVYNTPAVASAPAGWTPPPRSVARPAAPAWMVTALVALGLIMAVGLVYWLISSRDETERATAPPARLESITPSAGAASGHPYAKHIEVTGFRIIEEKRRPQLKFLVVNHSSAELSPGPVSIALRTDKSEPGDNPLATIRVQMPDLGPYESREMTTALDIKLRAYEMPDWQFLRADLEFRR